VAVTFPEDDSKASQLARIQAALVTLQNLEGPGVGCPASSTTLVAQQKAVQKGEAPPTGNGSSSAADTSTTIQNGGGEAPPTKSSSSNDADTTSTASQNEDGGAAPTKSSSSNDADTRTAGHNGGGGAVSTGLPSATLDKPSATATSPTPIESGSSATGNIDPTLIPDLGAESGLNPTGSGDCDGAVNGADGKPIKVPCQCPPDNDTYVQVRHEISAGRDTVTKPETFPGFEC
jgi:hypothetical protein